MKRSVLVFILSFLCLALGLSNREKPVKHDYKPSDFKANYQIDLKQDGYLILDEYDEVYYVPFGELETWFEEDNM